jgi:hypothetical protein
MRFSDQMGFGWQNLTGYWRIRGILFSPDMGQIG